MQGRLLVSGFTYSSFVGLRPEVGSRLLGLLGFGCRFLQAHVIPHPADPLAQDYIETGMITNVMSGYTATYPEAIFYVRAVWSFDGL